MPTSKIPSAIVPPDLLVMVAVSPGSALTAMPATGDSILPELSIVGPDVAQRHLSEPRRRPGSEDVAGVGEIEIRHVEGVDAHTGQADDAPVIHDGHVLGAGNGPQGDAVAADNVAARLVDDGAILQCLEIHAGAGLPAGAKISPLLISVLPLKPL